MKTVREKLKKIVSLVLCGATALSLVGTSGVDALSGAVTAWAAEAEGLDPVGTDAEYIGENLDSAYITATGEARLVNAVIANQWNYGYDGYYGDADNVLVTTAAVYDFGETNAYLAARVGIIQSTPNDTAEFRNANGSLVDGCIYDAETGIAYIPRELFTDDDGNYAYMNVQVFVQHAADWTRETVSVSVSVNDDAETRTLEPNDDVGGITLDAGLDADAQVAVFINGIMSDGYLWDYDSETGNLTVDLTAAKVSDITVVTGEKSEINALKEAYGEMYIYYEYMSEPMDNATSGNDASAYGDVGGLSLAALSSSMTVSFTKWSDSYNHYYGTHYTHYFTVEGTASDGSSPIPSFCANPTAGATPSGTYTATAYTGTNANKIHIALYYGYGGAGYMDTSYGLYYFINTFLTENYEYSGVALVRDEFGTDAYALTHVIVSMLYGSANWDEGISTSAAEALENYLFNSDTTPYNRYNWSGISGSSLPGTVYIINDGSNQPQFFLATSITPATGYLQVYKSTDTEVAGYLSGNYSFAGAKYTVYTNSSCTTVATDVNGSSAVLTIGSSGYSGTVELDVGTYWVKETYCPEDFDIDGTAHEVSVTSSNTSSSPATVYSTDEPKKGKAMVQKVSSNSTLVSGNPNYSLKGAVYGIYNSADDAKNETNAVTTLTTGDDGYTPEVELACGSSGRTYYVKEITASKGYEKDTADYILPSGSYPGVQQITVTENTTTTVTSTETVKFDPLTISLTKIDKDTGELLSYDEASTPEGDADLSGAQFTVKFYAVDVSSGTYTSASSVSGLTPTKTWVIQTKLDPSTKTYVAKLTTEYLVSSSNSLYSDSGSESDDGSSVLPMGVITVTETKTPTGYLTDGMYYIDEAGSKTTGTTWFGVIEESGGEVVLSSGNEYYAADTVIQGGLSVQKIDYMLGSASNHADANLSGAEFTIVNASENSCVNSSGKEIASSGLSGDNVTYAQVLAAASTSTMEVITSNASGFAKTASDALPYGTYYIIETKAPTGYEVNTNWVGRAIIQDDGVTVETETVADKSYSGDDTVADQIYRGGLSLTKADYEDRDLADEGSTPQGMSEFSGATFAIINASKALAKNKDGVEIPTAASLLSDNPTYAELRELADAGTYTMQTITTDENGYAATGEYDLPYGTYYVIETAASYGYWIDESFVGKAVIRDDGYTVSLGESGKGTSGKTEFLDINDASSKTADTVDQQVRRGDLNFTKTNIDGDYEAYIPFLISAIYVDPDTGEETELESHVIVSDAKGYVDTSRTHSVNTNGFDKYVENGKVTEEGEKLLAEASGWGVWFQGGGMSDNATPGSTTALRDDYGALYPCYYRITELECSFNEENDTNLQSGLMYIGIPKADWTMADAATLLSEALDGNANVNSVMYTYHPLVDTIIQMSSKALDVQSETQVVSESENAEVQDTVSFTNLSVDHDYCIATKFVDITDNYSVVPVMGTYDEDAYVRVENGSGIWVAKKFSPDAIASTNNTDGHVVVNAIIDTTGRAGHTIVAVDYLYEYEYIDSTSGNWELVKIHEDYEDTDQMLYVPDLHTWAVDGLTGDREGALSTDDYITDTVYYTNLAGRMNYVLIMYVADAETGEPVAYNDDGSVYAVQKRVQSNSTGIITGTVTMPKYEIDTSAFAGRTLTVIETLYLADEDDNHYGDPVAVHNSLLDEDETIRYPAVATSASDLETTDDVGTVENPATLNDWVTLSNLVFDDDDHGDGSAYCYIVKGLLVYQKDYTDADGVKHKAGDTVETLDGTEDSVIITSDAAGNIVLTYADGTTAEGGIVSSYYGKNVEKYVDADNDYSNDYVTDANALVADVQVRMIYKVDSELLADGTVVAYAYLYHDSEGSDKVLLASHEDITETGQTVHFPEVYTTALDKQTGDHVGANVEDTTVTDTVYLYNLVPGRTYTVKGILMDQDTGEEFLVNGSTVTQEATFTVAEDGSALIPTNNEHWTIDYYDAELNQVDGTIDLVFTFDASALEGETVVAYEDLYHNDVRVAFHHEIYDTSQSVYFPEIRSAAWDGYTTDHVGDVSGDDYVYDTIYLWNLVIGEEYTVYGIVCDKDTGEPLLDADGNYITEEFTFTVGENHTANTGLFARLYAFLFKGASVGTSDGAEYIYGDNGSVGQVTYMRYDEEKGSADAEFVLAIPVDTTGWEGVTAVIYETLYHGTDDDGNPLMVANDWEYAADTEYQTLHYPRILTVAGDVETGDEVGVDEHEDLTDLDQMVYFPEIHTTARDINTGDHVGTVEEMATIVDDVYYYDLVYGREYTVSGYLVVQGTDEIPLTDEAGNLITAEKTFIAGEDTDFNVTSSVDELNRVCGVCTLTFTLDSRLLAGQTVVAFEDLYHNDVDIEVHHDITDASQSVHYPDIYTTALDVDTGTHVGSIWGRLINGVRRLLGQDVKDGQTVVDTVELVNLVPGQTYVIKGKLYDKEASAEAGYDVPLIVDGEEVTASATITVAEDGSKITAAGGEKTKVTYYDEEYNTVNGTVELEFDFDSSLVQGTSVVAFELLYHDETYTPETTPDEVPDEDVVATHEDIDDEDQTVYDTVDIRTTAVDTTTGAHVGAVPDGDGTTVINDTVELSGLVPDIEYTVAGMLVDISADGFSEGTATYLTADGGLTEDPDEAYTQSYTFTAEEADATVYLNFPITTDKVAGMSITVFENVSVAGVVIASHPAESDDGVWDEDEFASQTVYYPAGKTNATDNITGEHTSFAEETSTITDRVWFENLLVGEEYTIKGYLVYEEDFVDANGVLHEAGERVTDEERSVTFIASGDLTEVPYDDDADVEDESAGYEAAESGADMAKFDSVTVTTLDNGQQVVSGYVSLTFTVDASALAGATTVTFEDFYYDTPETKVVIFVHHDLTDTPQTTKFPKISTNASVGELDEASVYDENGNFVEITVTDLVYYENLWTVEELEAMAEDGRWLSFSDGTVRESDEPIYDINEAGTYILMGVLMDADTGEPLYDSEGNMYVTFSEPFTADEGGSGVQEMTFTISGADFLDGLEGRHLVVYEYLYLTTDDGEPDEEIAEHEDPDDDDQDIRLPKGRTHATATEAADGGSETIEGLAESHENDEAGAHLVNAGENASVTDYFTYENLHGGTEYTLTATLELVTQWDEDGVPCEWEAALDANGVPITQTITFTTDGEYDDLASGCVEVVFEFDASLLAGSTMVAFEEADRNGQAVIIHADITDEAETIYLPNIQTEAVDTETSLKMIDPAHASITDTVYFENLIPGIEYTVTGTEMDKGTGEPITDEDGNVITASATFTPEEESGEVEVVFEFDASDLGGHIVVAFEKLYYGDDEIASHEDIDDDDQSVTVKEPVVPEGTVTVKTGDNSKLFAALATLLTALAIAIAGAAWRRRRTA